MSSLDKPSVATSIARFLGRRNVRRVYGVPGEDHMEILAALADQGIPYVGAHDESAACIMAGAESQLTGRPAVAMVTLAPGLTNAINGIANSYLDNLPLIVVCGQHPVNRQSSVIRQYLDNRSLVAGVTKAFFSATATINHDLARAFANAVADPPGPVLLEVRDEISRQPAMDEPDDWDWSSTVGAKSWNVPDEVVELLANAAHPAILVGSDVFGDPLDQIVGRVAAELRAPVFVTPSAKGRVAADDLWLAGTFVNGNLEHGILGRADVIVAIDLDAHEIFNRPWPYVPIVALASRVSTQHYFPCLYEVVGAPRETLAALHAQLSERDARSEWNEQDVVKYRQGLTYAFSSDAAELTIPAVIKLVQDHVPKDIIVAVDAGFGKALVSYLWTTGKWPSYFTSSGLSTMGYAIPAANALQLATPLGQRVVAFMGDGSLLMRAAEISVAVALRLPCIYLVWMDAALTQIGIKQRRSLLGEVGTKLLSHSCSRIGEAFGAAGQDVYDLVQLSAALDEALARTSPTLIGVHVDQSRSDEWFERMRG